MYENYIKSGKILSQAREYGYSILKEGISLLEVVEKVEQKIIDLGGKPAFPTDVSINHIAAHDSPRHDDKRVIKKGDLVKLDLGVHVNGGITDSAITKEIGTNNHKDIINATNEALKEVEKNLKIGIKVWEIGSIIEEVIKKKGFSPVRNLSGHQITDFIIHAGLTIPNYNNGKEDSLKKGMVVAIEPFASPGDGIVIEGKPAEVYGLVNENKNIRDTSSRQVLNFIKEEYKTMPFCKRWIAKEFNGLKADLTLKNLEREGIIKQYSQLIEKSRSLVSQTEHTFLIDDKVINLTK